MYSCSRKYGNLFRKMMIALTLFGFNLTNILSMGHVMYFVTLQLIKVTESEKYIRFQLFFLYGNFHFLQVVA